MLEWLDVELIKYVGVFLLLCSCPRHELEISLEYYLSRHPFALFIVCLCTSPAFANHFAKISSPDKIPASRANMLAY